MKWGALLALGVCLLASAVPAAGRSPAGHTGHHNDIPAASAALDASGADVGCWEEYVRRALEIYENLAECLAGNEWYDMIGYWICEASYEFGALMAALELIECFLG
jgi:hypothetical protein